MPIWSNHSLKAPLQLPVHWRLSFQHMHLWGTPSNHIQTIAMSFTKNRCYSYRNGFPKQTNKQNRKPFFLFFFLSIIFLHPFLLGLHFPHNSDAAQPFWPHFFYELWASMVLWLQRHEQLKHYEASTQSVSCQLTYSVCRPRKMVANATGVLWQLEPIASL